MMETIVRRGRIKGFIPWLITQRPAVVNKDVLSQVDGLVAFKLTSSNDRDALGAWVEGQADDGQWKAIYNALPTKARGEAVVWLPGHGILSNRMFPEKVTFDSSRTPKRGEKKRIADLKPIDLSALKQRLATVEQDAKANDPKLLRAEVARLQAELRKAQLAGGASPSELEAARHDGIQIGFAEAMRQQIETLQLAQDKAQAVVQYIGAEMTRRRMVADETPKTRPPAAPAKPALPTPQRTSSSAPTPKSSTPAGDLTGPQRTFLQSLAWWRAMGHEAPSRVQVASICGWRVTSGHLKNVAGSLRTKGLIDYPSDGTITLTADGAASAPAPDLSTTLEESVRAILTGPQRQVFDILPKDGRPKSRDQVAQACGWEVTSGHVKNVLGSMRSLEVITYPSQGQVARAEWVRS
jgi:uncharacterized protein